MVTLLLRPREGWETLASPDMARGPEVVHWRLSDKVWPTGELREFEMPSWHYHI